ncbi:uncharacterized protein PAN0_011c4282 [Moesziomyces antarcticus]|uniref:Uncharacterized protein n=1 Tax=Pseudozyma antarctica TaxID=84753 RepID=A0A081CHB4_PSEA2|nr:uncharacterized protein PAN0_011c4282 [Moesziomyces antarcticus]GAK66060.1 hypothetical protein PAN0_011c4282 [Moesziomyces antarcticus]
MAFPGLIRPAAAKVKPPSDVRKPHARPRSRRKGAPFALKPQLEARIWTPEQPQRPCACARGWLPVDSTNRASLSRQASLQAHLAASLTKQPLETRTCFAHCLALHFLASRHPHHTRPFLPLLSQASSSSPLSPPSSSLHSATPSSSLLTALFNTVDSLIVSSQAETLITASPSSLAINTRTHALHQPSNQPHSKPLPTTADIFYLNTLSKQHSTTIKNSSLPLATAPSASHLLAWQTWDDEDEEEAASGAANRLARLRQ